ncbi:hypothetical protein M2317_001483 [Microbacterium sp. ZKA21]|uniref:DUF2510 domain-containing protein n=1 Tax=Microbacterium sp. ZKA21 TaxID=3381694 RepID=UPI003D1BCD42
MSTPAGWYDAGTPGHQRWWDGVQWTAQERVAPVIAPPMGWYPVPGTSDIRWWDGTAWTPYRVRDGRPKPDAFAIEPAATGIVLGIVFLLLATMQVLTGLISSNGAFPLVAVLMAAAGAVWLIGGISTNGLRRLPAPQGAPFAEIVVRPLPGDVEGQGAGWYPVTGQAGRWWTGARWSWYVGMKIGVRPGHFGPRSYRISMIAGWVLAAIAFLALAVGALGIGIGLAASGDDILAGLLGFLGIPFGLILAGLALFILLLTRSRRYAMVLPEGPPPVR